MHHNAQVTRLIMPSSQSFLLAFLAAASAVIPQVHAAAPGAKANHLTPAMARGILLAGMEHEMDSVATAVSLFAVWLVGAAVSVVVGLLFSRHGARSLVTVGAPFQMFQASHPHMPFTLPFPSLYCRRPSGPRLDQNGSQHHLYYHLLSRRCPILCQR